MTTIRFLLLLLLCLLAVVFTTTAQQVTDDDGDGGDDDDNNTDQDLDFNDGTYDDFSGNGDDHGDAFDDLDGGYDSGGGDADGNAVDGDFDDWDLPSIQDIDISVCNVCGDNNTIQNPLGIPVVPSEFADVQGMTCEQLQVVAVVTLTANDTEGIEWCRSTAKKLEITAEPCQCTTPDGELLADLIIHSDHNDTNNNDDMQPSCNICGKGNIILNFSGVLVLPFDDLTTFTCEQLQDLADTDIDPETAAWCRTQALQYTMEPCQCATPDGELLIDLPPRDNNTDQDLDFNDGTYDDFSGIGDDHGDAFDDLDGGYDSGGGDADGNAVDGDFDDWDLPSIQDIDISVCNVCGDNNTIQNPLGIPVVPSEFADVQGMTCEQLQVVAVVTLTANDTEGIEWCRSTAKKLEITAEPCQCTTPDGELLADLIIHSDHNDTNNNDDMQPSCNICGKGNIILNSSGILDLPFDDLTNITCEQLQDLADTDINPETEAWCRTQALQYTMEECQCATPNGVLLIDLPPMDNNTDQDGDNDDNGSQDGSDDGDDNGGGSKQEADGTPFIPGPSDANCTLIDNSTRFECTVKSTLRGAGYSYSKLSAVISCDFQGDFNFQRSENCECEARVERTLSDRTTAPEKICSCSLCPSSTRFPVTTDCSALANNTLSNDVAVDRDPYVVNSCTSISCDLECNSTGIAGDIRLDPTNGKIPADSSTFQTENGINDPVADDDVKSSGFLRKMDFFGTYYIYLLLLAFPTMSYMFPV